MHCVRTVTDNLYWVGANDHRLTLFENIHPIPRGVSYNAYLLLDEKSVLFDTVDWSACRQLLENIQYLLNGKPLDYLVINHMEPDHGASIEEILLRYPKVKVISTEKAFMLMRQFGFHVDGHECIEVAEGDSFSFGQHNITFVGAPMVHWPEAMVSFDTTNGVLFSADAFGSFIALDGKLFADEVNFDRDWIDEARRYLTNIVGKYGAPVQTLLKKASQLDIKTICPLHGPILTDTIEDVIKLYNTWSSYQPEDEGVFIAYASIHGNTAKAAEKMKEILEAKGCKRVAIADLSRDDIAECVEDAFRHSTLLCMASSYDGGVFAPMSDFIHHLQSKTFQNRKVAFVENGSWAPTAAKTMKAEFEKMKNITLLDSVVTLKSTMNDANMEEIVSLAQTIADSIKTPQSV